MTVALVSAIFGGYDHPKPLPADHGFDDAVLVTDVAVEVRGWRTVVWPSDLPPRLAAKRAKCVPWEFTDADCSVWIDGAYAVNDWMLRVAVDRHLEDADLVVSAHWEDRDDVAAEAAWCADWPKYADQPLRQQVAHYRAAGLPTPSGLYACGTVARRHTAQQVALGVAWLWECHQWSIQDQVSFPYVCWRAGITPATWEVPVTTWLTWQAHSRDD